MVGVGKINRECLCGSIDFDRVKVERPSTSPYVTAFIECRRCKVMYHSPAVSDPPKPPPYTGPLITGRVEPVAPLARDSELMAAVARANKSKSRGRKG